MENTYPAQPTSSPWLIRLPILVIIGGALFVGLLVAFVIGVQAMYASRVVPGVWVNGVNVGGMTRAEAAAALQNSFTYDKDAVFTFRHDDQFWQLTAGELGVAFDAEATIEQAMQTGRESDPLVNVIEQASIWLNGRAVPPIVHYDQNVAVARLTDIARKIDHPAQDATLDINGIFITSTPATTGQTVDLQATLNQLDNMILRMDTGGELTLNVVESPPLVVDTEAAAARARAAVSNSILIMAEAPDGQAMGPWTATPNQIGELLTKTPVYNADGTVSYDVDINVQAFRSFLANLAPSVATAPKNGRFHFNDDTGQLEVFEEAVNGRELDIDETLLRLRAAIFNPDPNARRVPVAFKYILPQYHNDITATELGITELVSEGTTYYTGSTASRIQNIIKAAQRFDGVIIAPGEEFSYNKILGDISPEEGFVEGFVIVGDRTVKGVGGGVCQVSTTVFQAAFYAGYPITERWTHGYRVGYYETGEGVGMDAVIYQGDPALGERSLDLKFVNDTPYHLLIETSIYPANDAVQFRFYSTNPGRQVIKIGPEISNVQPAPPTVYRANPDLRAGQEHWLEWPAEGAYVVVHRKILDANGNELDDTSFRATYRPWGALVEVAPGDPRLASTG